MRMSFRPSQDLLKMNLRGRLLFLLAPTATAAVVHVIGLQLFGQGISAITAAVCAAIVAGVVGFRNVDEPFACAIDPVACGTCLTGIASLVAAWYFSAEMATFAAITATLIALGGVLALVPISSAALYDGSPTTRDLWLMRLMFLAPIALSAIILGSDRSAEIAAVGGLLVAASVATVKLAPQGRLSIAE